MEGINLDIFGMKSGIYPKMENKNHGKNGLKKTKMRS